MIAEPAPNSPPETGVHACHAHDVVDASPVPLDHPRTTPPTDCWYATPGALGIGAAVAVVHFLVGIVFPMIWFVAGHQAPYLFAILEVLFPILLPLPWMMIKFDLASGEDERRLLILLTAINSLIYGSAVALVSLWRSTRRQRRH